MMILDILVNTCYNKCWIELYILSLAFNHFDLYEIQSIPSDVTVRYVTLGKDIGSATTFIWIPTAVP